MAKTLAYSDKELMLKFAKKKYHKYIINKLSYQMKHVKDRHESDFRNFQEKHQHEIQALENERTYDSQIDRIIRNPKMVKFESMIEKIQEHIHFLSLEDLVGYFLNSVIELKYFSFYSADLNKKINSLEEEISEFKYIINLLEYNTQYHTALEDIKQKKDSEVNSAKCRRLAEVQYYVLSRMFLDFKDSMMDLFDSDDVVIRNHRKEIWKYLEESISKELKDQKKNPSEGAERNSRLYNLQKAALEKDPYEGFTWEDPLERLRFVTASVINEHRKLKFSNKTNRKTMFLNTLLVSPDVQINSEFNRKYDSMVNSASDFYKSSGLAKESALRDIANPIVYNK